MGEDFDYEGISDAEIQKDPCVVVQQLVFALTRTVAGLGGITVIVLLFIKGFTWYWEALYPTLATILAIPVLLCFPTGLVLAIFRKSRGVSGLLLFVSVICFFAANWLQVVGYAYAYA